MLLLMMVYVSGTSQKHWWWRGRLTRTLVERWMRMRRLTVSCCAKLENSRCKPNGGGAQCRAIQNTTLLYSNTCSRYNWKEMWKLFHNSTLAIVTRLDGNFKFLFVLRTWRLFVWMCGCGEVLAACAWVGL